VRYEEVLSIEQRGPAKQDFAGFFSAKALDRNGLAPFLLPVDPGPAS